MNERLNEILKAHTKEFEEVSDAIWGASWKRDIRNSSLQGYK